MTVFDDIRQRLGCSYISDFRFGMRSPEISVKLEMHLRALDYTRYPLKELERLYEYLFDELADFCGYVEAEQCFVGRSNNKK